MAKVLPNALEITISVTSIFRYGNPGISNKYVFINIFIEALDKVI